MGNVDVHGALAVQGFPMTEQLIEEPRFPPTAAWWDHGVASAFVQTAFQHRQGERWVLPLVLLPNAPLSAADTFLDPASAIPSGALGDLSYVIVAANSDITNTLRIVARDKGAPIWISKSWSSYFDAEPAGPLTEAERDALEVLRRRNGEATAAQLADDLKIEAAAAGNRLVGLERKGFVFRQKRSKRDGDLFLVPLFTNRLSNEATPANATAAVTLELPIEVRDEIQRIAQLEDVSEEVVLARAWLSYLRERQPELEAERRRLQDMDDEAYLTATQADLDEQVRRLTPGTDGSS
jgi:DNA-binding Lrp family transcriptional regulator